MLNAKFYVWYLPSFDAECQVLHMVCLPCFSVSAETDTENYFKRGKIVLLTSFLFCLYKCCYFGEVGLLK